MEDVRSGHPWRRGSGTVCAALRCRLGIDGPRHRAPGGGSRGRVLLRTLTNRLDRWLAGGATPGELPPAQERTLRFKPTWRDWQ